MYHSYQVPMNGLVDIREHLELTLRFMPIIEKYRPDLTVATIPAYPTGLGLITNLDPTNTVLEDNFDAIVAEMKDVAFDYQRVNLVENNFDILENLLNG